MDCERLRVPYRESRVLLSAHGFISPSRVTSRQATCSPATDLGVDSRAVQHRLRLSRSQRLPQPSSYRAGAAQQEEGAMLGPGRRAR